MGRTGVLLGGRKLKDDWHGLYNLAVWHRVLRPHQLAKEPTCCRCRAAGKIVAATVVNHVVPHKGDMRLFSDPDNLESVCKPCHDGEIQHQERTGTTYSSATAGSGEPVDQEHPFYQ